MAHCFNLNPAFRPFPAGIAWDRREPLPRELQGHADQLSNNVSIAAYVLSDQASSTPAGPGRRHAVPRHGAKLFPSFTVQEEHGRNVLPPLSITLDVSVVQDTASVTVTQLFWNDADAQIKEAAFTFPLPAGCTVTDFSCRVGTNKIIRGTVKPKEEAREAFQQHIRHHDTAAGLLEQDTSEVFTTTLGNISEKTKIKVNLTYITLLKHRFAGHAGHTGVTTLTIPTFIASRYGAPPEEYGDAATTNVPRGLSMVVEIVESERISSICCPSHAIAVERHTGLRCAESFVDLAGDGHRSNIETASVKLESGSMFLDKDFVLDIVTTPDGNTEGPQAWLEEHPVLPNHKALMLILPPGFMTQSARPIQNSEILFLADLSGSMEDKIDPLRSAMQFFLKGIPEGRKFNVWCFGSTYKSWTPSSVDYNEETLRSALSWVATSFAADMGGTELLPAVKAIVAARDKTMMTDVIILTDGETWHLDETLDYIQKTRARTEGRVRVFALGIGSAVSHALVDGIAKAGGGYAEVVQQASECGWEDRVVSMAKAALISDHLGPLHLELSIQDPDGTVKGTSLTGEEVTRRRLRAEPLRPKKPCLLSLRLH